MNILQYAMLRGGFTREQLGMPPAELEQRDQRLIELDRLTAPPIRDLLVPPLYSLTALQKQAYETRRMRRRARRYTGRAALRPPQP